QGGGTVTGHLTALSAADSGLVALRDAELDAQDFDLEFARPFLDTLPFAGWLNGHTTATGPVSGLTLDVDWTFRDSLVPGRPETRIRGRGDVALGGGAGGDLRFQPFTVKAVVDLGTVERLVPAAALHGLLYADGTLNGPLRDVQFTGTLEHRDGARPPTRLTGTVRLDGRSDTLGVYADLTADSLSFDGLKGSFSALPLRGAVAGRVQLSGPLAARHLYVDSLRLAQPGLITTGSGALGWGHGDRGTLALDFNADSLNSLDSLLSWVTAGGSDRTADGDPRDPGGRPLTGAARVLVGLEGS